MCMTFRWPFALLIISLSGCVILPIPHNRRMTPLYHRTVVAADDGRPLPAVSVKAESRVPGSHTHEAFEALTQSDEEGHYQVAAVRHSNWFFVWFLSPFEGPCDGMLTFSHPRYETLVYESTVFSAANIDGVCTGVKHEKNVRLKKRTSN
jgi:hypothetical protein